MSNIIHFPAVGNIGPMSESARRRIEEQKRLDDLDAWIAKYYPDKQVS